MEKHDAARLQALVDPRGEGLGGVVAPVFGDDVPGDHPVAEPTGVEPGGRRLLAVGGPEEAFPAIPRGEDLGGAADLELPLAAAEERHGRMVPGVIADRVTGAGGALDDLRMAGRGLADHEEGATRAVRLEQVEEARRPERVGAVVEGQRGDGLGDLRGLRDRHPDEGADRPTGRGHGAAGRGAQPGVPAQERLDGRGRERHRGGIIHFASMRPARIGEAALLAALLAAQLAPLWLLDHVPTQDGPGHLAVANVLRAIDRPEGAALRDYYVANDRALPNVFIYAVLAQGLGFLPLPVAEKVLLSAYVLGLPLAALYALRGVRPDAGFLATLVVPFTYGFLFWMGFYNFCVSLVAFLVAVGFWLRHGERPGLGRMFVLAALLLWTAFCHPVSVVMAVLAILGLAAWDALLDLRERQGGRIRIIARRLLPPLAASLPGLALVASFVGERMGARTSSLGLWVKVKHLAALYSLAALDRRTAFAAAALALLVAALGAGLLGRRLAALRARGNDPMPALEPGDGLLLLALGFVLVDLLAPSELAGGGFVNHRLALFPWLAAILWLGTGSWSGRLRWVVQAAAAAVTLGFLALQVPLWLRLDRQMGEVAAVAARVPPDRTLVAFPFSPQGVAEDGRPLAFRTGPLRYAEAYAAARRRIVDLTIFQPNEDYFPVEYRPDRNPYVHLGPGGGMDAVPPCVGFAGYERRTGGRVDYVLVSGVTAKHRAMPETAAFFRQLAAGYERVAVSPGGFAELWGVTTPTSASPTDPVTRRVPVPVAREAQARPVGAREVVVQGQERHAALAERRLERAAGGAVVLAAALAVDDDRQETGAGQGGAPLHGGQGLGARRQVVGGRRRRLLRPTAGDPPCRSCQRRQQQAGDS